MATQQDLGRLERVIGAILRGGVAISAVLMVTGLVLTAIGSTHAGLVLNAGLVLLMMIPTARIVVSFVDAALRRDALLAVATAAVLVAGCLLLPPLRQTLFFSATMGPEIRRLADAFLINAKEITVAPSASVAAIITFAVPRTVGPARPPRKSSAPSSRGARAMT